VKKKLIDFENPFFKPMWIRVLVLAFLTAWGFFEFAAGEPAWSAVFLAISAFCGWRFATIDYNRDIGE
jgi:hypothetical protein